MTTEVQEKEQKGIPTEFSPARLCRFLKICGFQVTEIKDISFGTPDAFYKVARETRRTSAPHGYSLNVRKFLFCPRTPELFMEDS
jgi:hypothetical protein